MKMQMHSPNPPAEMLIALDKAPLRYTEPVGLYHRILVGLELDAHSYCGVFGDGENGAYEWFVWRKGVLETSDVAYGIAEIALRDVLNKAVV